ncbi:hypothetical protein E1B28_010703 [Marasmius oreades]|uniref:Transmembrane protein n=1 Tax=Marasmius oreades TaxID=181124 RepID=A0A9P7UTX8_9AGAR|nr:uncharacterized protein E1B28_010703 [Marasmius oreades]KAG7091684.1 hypothetical protein E1B28_010703 [Marasmius oreades]
MSYSAGWIRNEDPRFFGGSYTWAHFTSLDSSTSAALMFAFQGTAVSFWGITPFDPVVLNTKLPLLIKIDGIDTPPSFPLYREPDGTYSEMYRSPVLHPGKHNISLTNIYGVYLDFAIVYGDPSLPIVNGSTILIDDTDPGIRYHGNWNVGNEEKFLITSAGLGDADPVREISGRAMGNTTHATKNVGDGFSVSFNGTVPSVYGIIDARSNGTIHVTFTLDGEPSNKIYQIPGPGIDPGGGQLLNHLLYQNGAIKSGPHTLEAQLTAITGDQSLLFDYFTYRWLPSSNGTSPGSVGGTSNGNGTGSTTPSPVPSNHSSKPVRSIVGAVVGSVFGALVLGVIVICLLVRWRKKRRTEKVAIQVEPWISDHKAGGTNDILASEIKSYSSPSPVPVRRKSQEAHTLSAITEPDEEMIGPGPLMYLTGQQPRNEGVREQIEVVNEGGVNEGTGLVTGKETIPGLPAERPRPTIITELSGPASVQSPGAQTEITELTSRVNTLTREVQRLRRSFIPFFAPPSYNNTGESGVTTLPSYAHGESR